MDVLNIGLFEIGIIDFAHDTTPSLLGIEQVTVLIDVSAVEVVRATLTGIEREVQRLDHRRLAIVQLTSREHLAVSHLTCIRIGQGIQVILDVARRIGRVALREQAVNIIP